MGTPFGAVAVRHSQNGQRERNRGEDRVHQSAFVSHRKRKRRRRQSAEVGFRDGSGGQTPPSRTEPRRSRGAESRRRRQRHRAARRRRFEKQASPPNEGQ